MIPTNFEQVLNEADRIMEEYGFAETLYEPVESLLSVCLKKHLEVNETLWDKELLSYKPLSDITAPKELVIIVLCWKRFCESHKLKSSQSAKLIQRLRELGFVFAQNKTGEEWVVRRNGKEGRMITGVDISKAFDYGVGISPKMKPLFLKRHPDARDPFTLSRSTSQCNIDHRTPVEACKRLGIAPAVLTEESIESGRAIEDFQVLSRSNNCWKREVCAKCLAGKDIPLPDILSNKDKDQYRRRWSDGDSNRKSCVGCYFFNFGNSM